MTRASLGRNGLVIALLSLVVGGSFVLLRGAGAAPLESRKKEATESPKLVRWDIARCGGPSCSALVVGGHARWRSASGATITFTGSGQAEAGEHETAGGGVFTRRTASGRVVDRGTYVATRFLDWHAAPNPLGNVTDAIGRREEVRGGVIKLRVHLFATGRGRLIISSFGNRTGRGHLLLHTVGGRTIDYLEKIHPGGQPLFHRIR